MRKIYSLFNQKGGVGKTTLAINLSDGLANKKNQVLIVDLDPQGNTTSGLGVEKMAVEKTVYDVLVDDLSLKDVIIRVKPNLHVVPSNRNLAGADVALFSKENKEYLLKEKLEEIKEDYDYIIIDCPPSLGNLSINALVASKGVIIPIQCEYYALEGLSDLIETIERIRIHMNPELEIEGVIFNMYDPRNNLTEDVANEVKKYFGSKVYNTVIPRNVRLAEAPSYGESIFDYSGISKGAWAFRSWVKEFIQRSKK